jgi:hypothetical protein
VPKTVFIERLMAMLTVFQDLSCSEEELDRITSVFIETGRSSPSIYNKELWCISNPLPSCPEGLRLLVHENT